MPRFEENEAELLDRALLAIEALPNAGGKIIAQNASLGAYGRVDAIAELSISGRPFRLVIEVKREVFPRDVRETIWQLRNYLAHIDDGSVEMLPFLVAHSISPGARQVLQEEGIGYYDFGGALFIPSRETYVFIDRPPPRKTQKIFTSIFEGQRARVVRAVFDKAPNWLSVKELAKDLDISPATASATLSEMERRDWVEAEGLGPSKLRRLSNGRMLLDEWSEYIADQPTPKMKRYYVSMKTAEGLMRKLDAACCDAQIRYAVTGEAAAQLYAPYLSSVAQVRCRMAPGRHAEEMLSDMDARPVSEGWNLGIIDVRSASDVDVGQRCDGIALAPPIQVYLDLLQGAGRSKEMAVHLRAERLDF
ncbi:Transcriptional regulator, AbiEi antitoxin, Type IV TA system [Sphingopyxis sp. YR583]|uniref:type IV toxin-antitoxin system AbiEi family antitoxin n=1 Tax=Sphingopyxis sp. YR583 TaxID=1881047 RepID=UPI0008A765B2|nr:type IV toxin-antitoxin system AbiEi family antitoxin [Sphingopyxis sp. YR583]SEH15056.1 Transcriptional regulator, AbiEi antitoxin, Type IV TA system [Sphingopyxis sp. YR583]